MSEPGVVLRYRQGSFVLREEFVTQLEALSRARALLHQRMAVDLAIESSDGALLVDDAHIHETLRPDAPTHRVKMQQARAALIGFDLHGGNAEVAEYWLSKWTNDAPPARESFEPKHLSSCLPSMAIFEIDRKAKTVRCRLAGSHCRMALGYELTGKDLMSVTPEDEKAQRWANIEAILDGSVSVGVRGFRNGDGRVASMQEIALPFSGDANGLSFYLFHSNWRPQGDGWMANTPGRVSAALGRAQHIVSFGDDAR